MLNICFHPGRLRRSPGFYSFTICPRTLPLGSAHLAGASKYSDRHIYLCIVTVDYGYQKFIIGFSMFGRPRCEARAALFPGRPKSQVGPEWSETDEVALLCRERVPAFTSESHALRIAHYALRIMHRLRRGSDSRSAHQVRIHPLFMFRCAGSTRWSRFSPERFTTRF